MVRRLFLWLVLIGLTPAGPELVEMAVHFAREGDFVHAGDARHRRPPAQQAEHGCAVLCHACGCHGPTSVTRAERGAPRTDLVARRVNAPSSQHGHSQTVPAPPIPPPIA